MKTYILFITGFFLSMSSFAQNTNFDKGNFFFYWGWNNSHYTNSDLHLKGSDYNFTLHKIAAKDRQSPINWIYVNPETMTIPQYNYRVGYAFKKNWTLSLGMDHMKYVMVQDQQVRLTGDINNAKAPIQGQQLNTYTNIGTNLLTFEHTDGLNNLNAEVRHHKHIYYWAIDRKGRGIQLSAEGGIGIGAYIPKTNAQLFSQERHDEFHLSGWGAHGIVAAKLTFWRYFFAMSEFKAGYVSLPDIKINNVPSDKASQNFGYIQYNIVLGSQFPLFSPKPKTQPAP